MPPANYRKPGLADDRRRETELLTARISKWELETLQAWAADLRLPLSTLWKELARWAGVRLLRGDLALAEIRQELGLKAVRGPRATPDPLEPNPEGVE
jgi:hypothetical protein